VRLGTLLSRAPRERATVTFELSRSLVRLYAAAALGLSLVLLAMGRVRGGAELGWWLAAYAAVALLAWRFPAHAPLVAGVLAFLVGFVRTYRHGPNLDLGLSLVLLVREPRLVRGPRPANGPPAGTAGGEPPSAGEAEASWRTDPSGLLLLLVAAIALVSLAATIAHIRSFAPAPGFGYHVYRLNARGLGSDEAVQRALLGAAVVFSWFGCYAYARSTRLRSRVLAIALGAALLVNSLVLLVQSRLAPGFLHPAGWPYYDRLNGVASFCWALGDASLGFFLLLPLWGATRGRSGLLTAVNVLLLLHAVAASGSRTALVAMVGAALLWSFLRVRRWWAQGQRKGALGLAGSAVALAALLAVVYHLTPPDNSTPLGRLKEGISRQGIVGHLVATRLGSYPLTLRVIGAYPLSGIGSGLYPLEIDKQRALLAPDARFRDPFLVGSNAPNQFLNVGAELGLPAALALAGALLLVLCAAWRARRDPQAATLGVSALALLGALQLGPGLYNSEAVMAFWLVVGATAAAAARAAAAVPGERTVGGRAAWFAVAAAVLLAVAGQALSWRSLSVDNQWRRLRWRMNIGLQPAQTDGRWTAAEATFSVDTIAPELVVRWHTGDSRAAGFRPQVSFFVDGEPVERTVALPGRVHESVLPLPRVPGFKRISVRVTPPFVPAAALPGSDDRRALGVFLHEVTPREAAPGGQPAR
jgi:hypothetical protein